jgi:hypothetical protein
MSVIFSSGYAPGTTDSGFLKMESGDFLLLEDSSKIILDFAEVDDEPITHARIAHSQNWHLEESVLASTTATGYFAEAPTNTLSYEKWKPTAIPASWQATLTTSQLCDYCCIGAHTLGTNGNTLQVQYYNGSWNDLIPATLIEDDSDIFVIFPLQSHQIWRLYITGGTAPEVGVVKFGRALQMPRPLFGGHTPMLFARKTVMKTNESESGETLGRSKFRTYLETTYSWQNLPSSWIRSNWKTLQLGIETEAFFLAWRPGTYGEVAFGETAAVPAPTNNGKRDLMDVELQMKARSYD